MERASAWAISATSVAIAAVASICGLGFLALQHGDHTKQAKLPQGNTQFGEFLCLTQGDRELEEALQAESIDLGLVNWLLAADIPEFHEMARVAYYAQLNSLTERVRQAMANMRLHTRGDVDPNDPAVRCGRFCNAVIRLGFAYREEFREEDLTAAQTHALYTDADNLFLVGLLRTGRGSCVSMPLIYLVIGQRLGMPVHLVTVGKHYFIRWEEPGLRMNIEPTIVERVAVTPDDSVYLEVEGMTRAQVTGGQMRNLTGREVVGELLYTRSAYWANKGQKYKVHQRLDLSRARRLAPDDPWIKATYEAVFNFGGIKPQHTRIETSLKG